MGRWLNLLKEDSGSVAQSNIPTLVTAPTEPLRASQTRDEVAKARGWLVLTHDKAYEQTLSRYAAIYLLRDEGTDTWQVWRGMWRHGEREPFQQKTIAKDVGFSQALARGSNYIEWYRNRGNSAKGRG